MLLPVCAFVHMYYLGTKKKGMSGISVKVFCHLEI